MMSPWEQQHFVLNVHETFQRVSPKVPDNFYSIKFVPVIDEGETSYKPLPRSLLTTFGPDSDQPPHRLQVRSGCWCDLSSRAFFDQGLLYPSWVIEIHISRPDVEDPRTKEFLAEAEWMYKPDRYFVSDDGKAYIRQSTSTFALPKP